MLHKIPNWFQSLFTGYTWQIKTEEKVIYLTFDDGPTPEITEWVLSVLKDFSIKATFFVVGKNVSSHPKIFEKLIKDGHTVGNHTYNHVKGWRTSSKLYVEDVAQCAKVIQLHSGKQPTLFRAPYGRITTTQASKLRNNYELIMWNTLTADYDKSLHKKKCLRKSINATKFGSIVVFHDSIKAKKNLKYVLPLYIRHFLSQGYSFKVL